MFDFTLAYIFLILVVIFGATGILLQQTNLGLLAIIFASVALGLVIATLANGSVGYEG